MGVFGFGIGIFLNGIGQGGAGGGRAVGSVFVSESLEGL
jgi:hypothetical protein